MGFKLSPLLCTRCGAPIREEPVDDIISCDHCGQTHLLERAPAPAAAPPVATPRVSYALWPIVAGLVMLSGTVTFLTMGGALNATPQPATPSGPSAVANGPGDPTAVYAEGQSVDIYWGSSWWAGKIKRKNANATYRIEYTGWSSSWDEDVTAKRLRPH